MVRALLDGGAAHGRHELVIVNVLVFNPGSSSLKFEVIAADRPSPHFVRGRKLLSGVMAYCDAMEIPDTAVLVDVDPLNLL